MTCMTLRVVPVGTSATEVNVLAAFKEPTARPPGPEPPKTSPTTSPHVLQPYRLLSLDPLDGVLSEQTALIHSSRGRARP